MAFSRFLVCLLACCAFHLHGAPTLFSIATYNLENYLDGSAESRAAKTPESRAKVRECLVALRADVLALQEIGSTNALLRLQSELRASGLDYPHWEHVRGWDTNIHLAVLSRFPIVERRSHTNLGYLLQGRRLRVQRGFAEVEIQVNANYRFTLLNAHLKSRRQSPVADEAEMREQEALLLRQIVDARLTKDPKINLVVLGDFNDVKDSRTVRTLVGSRSRGLVDTRPAERNGDTPGTATPNLSQRTVTWTHYYGKEDTYSRVDYILLSAGMAREWKPEFTYVQTMPNWGLASDHRAVLASFVAEEK